MWTTGLGVAVARTPDKFWGLRLIKEIRNASPCGLTKRLSVYPDQAQQQQRPRCHKNLTTTTRGVLS